MITYHPEMLSDRFKRGEIYYISKSQIPAIGSEQIPGRPGIIVSNDTFNRSSSTVQVVYLTTQPKEDLESHVEITSASKPSTALCEQLSTVDKSRIGTYVGRCTDEEMEGIDDAIIYTLGLPNRDSGGCENSDNDCSDAELVAEVTKLRVERDTYKEVYNNLLKSFATASRPSAVGVLGRR